MNLEYRQEKLVVDELIFDPHYENAVVVRIGIDYYLVLNVSTRTHAPAAADLRLYKAAPPQQSWPRLRNYDYLLHHMIPRGGYVVTVGRAITPEEWTELCTKYSLTDDDMSDPLADTIGGIYGEDSAITVQSRQVIVSAPGHLAIQLAADLRVRGIEAAAVAHGRVNIRVG